MGQFQFGDKENKHPVGQNTIGDFDQILVGVDSFWPLQEETYGGGWRGPLVCRLGGLRFRPKLSAMPRAYLNGDLFQGNAEPIRPLALIRDFGKRPC